MTIDAARPSTGSGDDVRADRPDAPTDPRVAADARVPAADVVRDVVAAVALVAALALPWSFGTRTADHIEAVLSTVVALLAVPLPYLARAGVLPRGWTVATTRTVRLWAAVPFVVVAVVYLVIDLVNGAHTLQTHGVGTGLGIGLAGALLVAQPRRCELGPVEDDAAPAALWRLVLLVVTAVVAVGAVAALVIFFVDASDVTGNEVVLALCVTLITLVLGALPAWGAYQRDGAWRTVVVGIGSALAILFLVGSGGLRGLLTVESLHGLRFGLVLIPVEAAVAAGAAFARSSHHGDGVAEAVATEPVAPEPATTEPAEPVAEDADSAETGITAEHVDEPAEPVAETATGPVRASRAVSLRTLGVLALTSALVAISSAFSMAEGARGAAVVTSLVVPALIAVLAGLGWFALRSTRPGVDGALLVAFVALAAFVVGTVAVVVDSRQRAGTPIDIAMVAYGLPAILAFVLGSAAGRAWWTQSRTAAAGDGSSAYVWAPRPRVTPRVALTPAVARPARPEPEPEPQQRAEPEPVSSSQHTVEPAAEPVVEPVVQTAAEPHRGADATDVYPVATAADSQPADAPRQPAADDVPDEQTTVRRSWTEASRDAATAAQPTASHDDAGATAVLQPAVTEGGFTAEQAADPATPLEDLAKIAEHAPSLRPYVASNPSTYSALLEWLGALGDPAVDRALASRTDRER